MENSHQDVRSPSSESIRLGIDPNVRNIAFYRRALSPHLDPMIMEPNPWQLVPFFACILVSVTGVWVFSLETVSWPVKFIAALAMGLANGSLGFLTHEILHGSVIRNQRLQGFLSFFGTLPFFISPTFWKFWHNRLHHGKTQQLIQDPDAYPNMRIYKASKFMQFMYPFTPGSGKLRSYSYFFLWFSFHIFVAQIYLRHRNSLFEAMDHKKVSREFGGQILIFLGILIFVGPWAWPYLILALFIQNYTIMSYIATNHNLSPLTSLNDPLVNSLSVSNWPILEFLNFNFGYHVEHHIFPTVSGKHLKKIHVELQRQFPDTYKIMPKWTAMKALYKTARVYKNSTTLINPLNQKTYPTL